MNICSKSRQREVIVEARALPYENTADLGIHWCLLTTEPKMCNATPPICIRVLNVQQCGIDHKCPLYFH